MRALQTRSALWQAPGFARADIARFLQLDRELSLPVLTTDRRWKTLDLGLEVTLIR
jgi:PIN domain nuclease of toxin-antitoxin system